MLIIYLYSVLSGREKWSMKTFYKDVSYDVKMKIDTYYNSLAVSRHTECGADIDHIRLDGSESTHHEDGEIYHSQGKWSQSLLAEHYYVELNEESANVYKNSTLLYNDLCNALLIL